MQDLKGFLIKSLRLREDSKPGTIEVHLDNDARHRRRCSCCQRPAPGYDRLTERSWSFVPLWGMAVFFFYAPWRVTCPVSGKVRVEHMPWSVGKHRQTRAYMLFLAHWAKLLSWKKTAQIFRPSWDTVYRCVQWVVEWGLENRSLLGVEAIGIDELHWGRGKRSQNFVTVIYQIDAGVRRLLWVGQKRTEATLKNGFATLEKAQAGFLAGLKVVCSDMWKPYLKVIASRAGSALNVLDRFHVAKHLNAAVDQVRRGEQSRLRCEAAKKTVKRGRFILLKRGARRHHPKSRPHAPLPRGPPPQLFQGQEAVLKRRHRRPQPQGSRFPCLILWTPFLQSIRNRSLSQTRQPSRTPSNPQILLTRHIIVH